MLRPQSNIHKTTDSLLIPLTITVGFFLIGAIAFPFAFANPIRYYQSKNWISTQGKIVQVKSTGYAPRAILNVTYKFEVESQTYVNSRVDIGWVKSDESLAKAAMMKTGETMTVWYDPHNPSHSALFKVFAAPEWILLFLALGFTLTGGYGTLKLTREVRSRKSKNSKLANSPS